LTGLDGLGGLRAPVEAAMDRMNAQRWVDRLSQKDGTIWSADIDAAAEIARWMGWLDVAEELSAEDVLARLRALAEEVKIAGFTHAVLAGMGGSSLCPDVLRHTFGRVDGHPELLVLDSTDPSTIAEVEAQIDLSRTLFIIASKSGGTLETLSHMKYFYAKVRSTAGDSAGGQFIAITDEGSGLHQSAKELGFREVFLNRPDIGGRYSALSFFGMVPAAVMGLDFGQLLTGAVAMRDACRQADAHSNPGLELGAVLGSAANSGRDKCTIICSSPVATLGVWLEQLLAESTGKQGKGIIPVEGEPLGPPGAYGDDRLFVFVRTVDGGEHLDSEVGALRAAGHPVYTIEISGPGEIGAEFLRWEVATAIAGAVIGINPFDQPNVQESKDNTNAVLKRFLETGDFGVETPPDPWAEVEALLGKIGAGDYFALLAYTQPGAGMGSLLSQVREAVRDQKRVATTSGYGPRYLHSTGQLHKGGPNSGVFVILADQRGDDLPIPEAPYGFKTLIHAQWAGDLKSLRDHGRRVAMVDLGVDREAALRQLLEVAKQAVSAG
jgi:glucose-6-phosphate isomerase